MPRIEEIEEFNRNLIQTGNEPQVAEARGETIEDVQSPEAYPMDHNGPLTRSNRPKSTQGPAAAAPGPGSAPTPAGPSADDLFSSFLDIPEAAPAGEAEESTPPSAGFDDLFDNDLLGAMPIAPVDEDAETPVEPEALFDTDDFSLPPVDEAAEAESTPDFGDLGLDAFGTEETDTDLPVPEAFDIPEDTEPMVADRAGEPMEPFEPFETPESGASLEPDDSFESDLGEPVPSFPDLDSLGGDEPILSNIDESSDFNLDEDLNQLDSVLSEQTDEAPLPSADDFSLDDPFGTLDTPPAPAMAEEEDHSELDAFLGSFNPVDESETAPPREAPPADESDPFADFDSIGGDSSLPPADLDDAIPDADAFGTDNFDLDSFGSSPAQAMDESLSDDFGLDGAAETPQMPGEAPSFDEDLGGDTNMPQDIPDFGTDLDADFGTDDFPEEFSMGDFEKQFGVMDAAPSDEWKAPAFAAPPQDEALDEAGKATAADEAKDWEISKEDFQLLRESLAAMPLNLKIATEELLGNPDKPFKDLKEVIESLVAGESPQTLAQLVSRISGKKIKIPAGYAKRSGQSFEEERNSFSYRFVHNVLPVIRNVALAGLGILVGIWLIYSYIWTPMVAYSLYDQGIQAIKAGEYDRGNSLFEEAYALWPDNNKYVEYAETFTSMQEYNRSYRKYMELLGDINPHILPAQLPEDIRQAQIDRIPRTEASSPAFNAQPVDFKVGRDPYHRAGILSFATFSTWHYTPPTAKYENKFAEAVIYLERLIANASPDTEALVLQGDAYLAWADFLDDPRMESPRDKILQTTEFFTAPPMVGQPLSQTPAMKDKAAALKERLAILHEGARLAWARTIKIKGDDDFMTSKMLAYFMATGNQDHVNRILRDFLKAETLNADPAVIADLTGIMIDRAQGTNWNLEDAHQLLQKSIKSGTTDSGVFYQLARYYRTLRDQPAEAERLRNALIAFRNEEAKAPFTRKSLERYIDTLIRSGEVAMALDNPLEAQERLQEARKQYEDAILSKKIPQRAAVFGRLYARLGDIAYKQESNWQLAGQLYNLAIRNQYGENPLAVHMNRPALSEQDQWRAWQDLSYKRGFILYTQATKLETKPETRSSLLYEASRQFLNAQGKVVSPSRHLLLALGNTLTELGNYEAGISHYQALHDQLVDRVGNITFSDADLPSRRQLDELLFTTYNNLGVAHFRLYRNGGPNAAKSLELAQYYMVQASTLGQNRDRNQETGVSSEAIRISALNMDRILSPFARDSAFQDEVYLVLPLYRELESSAAN